MHGTTQQSGKSDHTGFFREQKHHHGPQTSEHFKSVVQPTTFKPAKPGSQRSMASGNFSDGTALRNRPACVLACLKLLFRTNQSASRDCERMECTHPFLYGVAW